MQEQCGREEVSIVLLNWGFFGESRSNPVGKMEVTGTCRRPIRPDAGAMLMGEHKRLSGRLLCRMQMSLPLNILYLPSVIKCGCDDRSY